MSHFSFLARPWPRRFLRRALLGAAVGLLPLGAATAQSTTFTLTSSVPRGLNHWGDRVELTFSRAYDPATSGGIEVLVGGRHAINTKGAGANDRQLIVTLASPPAPGAEIAVSVPMSVRSLGSGGVAGAALANPSVLVSRAAAGVGAGTYALASQPALPGTNPTDVQLTDVDGDGDLDACVASSSTGTVSVLLNDGAARLVPSAARRRSGLPACIGIRCADLDRDGDADLVAWSSTFVWTCANDGTGRFGPPVVVGGPQSGITEAGAADLDADGDLDLYFSDTPNNRIRTYANDAGVFGAPPVDVPCPGAPTGVACADMNNDGRPDFVACARDNGQVAILLWQLSQWLPARLVSTGTGSNPIQVATGDFDGDGLGDFVVSCDGDNTATPIVQGSALGWLSRTPTAALRLVRKKKLPPSLFAHNIMQFVLPADPDGDNDLDVVCVEDNALIGCANNGAGTFTDGASASQRGVDKNGQSCTGPRRPPGSANRMATGDLDGDGDLDVVTLGNASISVMENTPIVPITVVSPTPLGIAPRPVGPIKWMAPEALAAALVQGVVVRDDHGRAFTTANGLVVGASADGGITADLPAAERSRDKGQTWEFLGGKTATGKAIRPFSWAFDTRPEPSNGVFVNDGSTLTLATTEISTMGDWDGDGKNDVVVATPAGANCSLRTFVKWTGNSWRAAATISATPILDFTPSLMRCADLDADGHLDVVLAGISTAAAGGGAGPRVKVFDGASGALVEVQDCALASPATALELCDLDNDGILEIVTCDAAGRLFTRTKSNQCNERSYPTPGPVAALSFDPGDHTREAALYIATGSGPGGGPNVRRVPCDNTGVPRTDEAIVRSLAGNPSTLTLADLDGDSEPETVVATPALHAVHTIKSPRGEPSGAGQLRLTFSTGANSAPTQVCAADIDGDDDRDLVVVCPGTSTLWIGINDGGGNFTVTRTVAVGAVPQQAWLDDCDDDGIRDVVVRCADGSVRTFEVGAPSPLDLIISTAVTVPPGTYNSITVLDGGDATLAPITGGAVAGIVVGTIRVKKGGTVRGNISVTNAFVLEAGATLEVAQAAGLNPTTGPITGAGTRSFSTAANYVYTNPDATCVTGPDLPARVGNLLLGNGLNQLVLTNPLTVGGDPTAGSSGGGGAGKVSVRDFSFLIPIRKQLISNGKLTLASSARGTAVLDVSRIEVLGNVTVQTYLTAVPGGRGYRQFSPPVAGTTFGHLTTAGFTPVVNNAYNTAPNPIRVTPFPNVFGYDERRLPANPDPNTSFFSPDALLTPCPAGRGMTVYAPSGITWNSTGPVAAPQVLITGLTYTPSSAARSGWNLIGNQFPNVMCWDSVTVPAGLSASVSVWQSAGGNAGSYLTRANGMGTLPNGLIGVGQAFFCRVTDPTTPPAGMSLLLKAPTGIQDESKGFSSLIRRETPRPRLTLALGGATGFTDEATVYFQAGATAVLDDAFDGARPGRNVGLPTLATLTAAQDELAVNGLPTTDLTNGTTVELLLDLPTAGAYTLRVGDSRFLESHAVVLLDRLTATRYDLQQRPTVVIRATQAGEVRGRFAVLFNGGRVLGTTPSAPAPARLTLYPNPARTTVQISGAQPGAPVRLIDALGRTVRTLTAGTTTLDLQGVPAGVYTIRTGTATARLVVE